MTGADQAVLRWSYFQSTYNPLTLFLVCAPGERGHNLDEKLRIFRDILTNLNIQVLYYRYMEETGIHLPTVCKESLVQVQPCPSQLGHHGHHHPLIHDHWCDPGPGEWPTWGAEACQVASCLDRSQSFPILCWTALFYFVPQESDRQSGLAILYLSFQVPRWIPVLC